MAKLLVEEQKERDELAARHNAEKSEDALIDMIGGVGRALRTVTVSNERKQEVEREGLLLKQMLARATNMNKIVADSITKRGFNLVEGSRDPYDRRSYDNHIDCKSKGKAIDKREVSVKLGPQLIDNDIIPKTFGDRSFLYCAGGERAEQRGFVEQGYLTCLSEVSAHANSMNGAQKVAESSSEVCKTGTVQRAMMRATEAIVAQNDWSATDDQDRIIVSRYGDDGANPESLMPIVIPFTREISEYALWGQDPSLPASLPEITNPKTKKLYIPKPGPIAFAPFAHLSVEEIDELVTKCRKIAGSLHSKPFATAATNINHSSTSIKSTIDSFFSAMDIPKPSSFSSLTEEDIKTRTKSQWSQDVGENPDLGKAIHDYVQNIVKRRTTRSTITSGDDDNDTLGIQSISIPPLPSMDCSQDEKMTGDTREPCPLLYKNVWCRAIKHLCRPPDRKLMMFVDIHQLIQFMRVTHDIMPCDDMSPESCQLDAATINNAIDELCETIHSYKNPLYKHGLGGKQLMAEFYIRSALSVERVLGLYRMNAKLFGIIINSILDCYVASRVTTGRPVGGDAGTACGRGPTQDFLNVKHAQSQLVASTTGAARIKMVTLLQRSTADIILECRGKGLAPLGGIGGGKKSLETETKSEKDKIITNQTLSSDVIMEGDTPDKVRRLFERRDCRRLILSCIDVHGATPPTLPIKSQEKKVAEGGEASVGKASCEDIIPQLDYTDVYEVPIDHDQMDGRKIHPALTLLPDLVRLIVSDARCQQYNVDPRALLRQFRNILPSFGLLNAIYLPRHQIHIVYVRMLNVDESLLQQGTVLPSAPPPPPPIQSTADASGSGSQKSTQDVPVTPIESKTQPVAAESSESSKSNTKNRKRKRQDKSKKSKKSKRSKKSKKSREKKEKKKSRDDKKSDEKSDEKSDKIGKIKGKRKRSSGKKSSTNDESLLKKPRKTRRSKKNIEEEEKGNGNATKPSTAKPTVSRRKKQKTKVWGETTQGVKNSKKLVYSNSKLFLMHLVESMLNSCMPDTGILNVDMQGVPTSEMGSCSLRMKLSPAAHTATKLRNLMARRDLDSTSCFYTDIRMTYEIFGKHAARTAIVIELRKAMASIVIIDDRHFKLLAAWMMFLGYPIPVGKDGLLLMCDDFLRKVTYEVRKARSIDSAMGAERSNLSSVVSRFLAGQKPNFGTGVVEAGDEVLLQSRKLRPVSAVALPGTRDEEMTRPVSETVSSLSSLSSSSSSLSSVNLIDLFN